MFGFVFISWFRLSPKAMSLSLTRGDRSKFVNEKKEFIFVIGVSKLTKTVIGQVRQKSTGNLEFL